MLSGISHDDIRGTLKLFPPKYRLDDLEADYNVIKDMLYGDIPSRSVVTKAVGTLEREINGIKIGYART